MQELDLFDRFIEFEDDLDLFNSQVSDQFYWERIRCEVFDKIKARISTDDHRTASFNEEESSNFSRTIKALKNLFVKNPFFSGKHDIVFFGLPRRKLMNDGLWWDIFSDPIIDHLKAKYSCLLIEKEFQNSHKKPAKTSNIKYDDLIPILPAIFKKLSFVIIKLSERDNKLVDIIENEIQSLFKIKINLKGIIQKDLLVKKVSVPIYVALLKKIKPKVVFLLVNYTNNTKAIIEACKKLNIKSIELQHGSIYKQHIGYSFPGKGKPRYFPDFIFSFGPFWHNSSHFPLSQVRLISVGFPFLQNQKEEYSIDEKEDQIVFISQGAIGKRLSHFACSLAQEPNFHWKIIYKLHPQEYSIWNKEYPHLLSHNIEVIDSDSIPLYQIFAHSRAVVGVYSTAIYEGMGFGLQVYILDIPEKELIENIFEYESVEIVSSASQIVQDIENGNGSKYLEYSFFANNPLDNISKQLQLILSQ